MAGLRWRPSAHRAPLSGPLTSSAAHRKWRVMHVSLETSKIIQQLKPGGLMLIPVGPLFQRGNIYLVTKQADGSIKRKVVATGTFVPLRRTDI